MKILLSLLTILLCLLIGEVGSVEDEKSNKNDTASKEVVPAHEYEIAKELNAEGPTETTGIESSNVLGSIMLAGEFPGMEGYKIRVREVTVIPGGQVAVHQHDQRPGVAYMLEGELVEHRNDTTDALTRVVGAVALEKTGTIHWWENKSSANAKVLVVDIVSIDIE